MSPVYTEDRLLIRLINKLNVETMNKYDMSYELMKLV